MLRRILDHPRFGGRTSARSARLTTGPPPPRSTWSGGRWPPLRGGLLQHLRSDRDAGGLRRPDPRGPPAGRPVRLHRPPAARRRGPHPRRRDRGAGSRASRGSSWSVPARTPRRPGCAPVTSAGRDGEGYLFLTGRLSDTINRGGEKFGPVEVEEALRTHPAVVDVGVVGVPDAGLGERVGAVVVTAGPVDPGELVAHGARHWPATRSRSSWWSPTTSLPRAGQARPPGPAGPPAAPRRAPPPRGGGRHRASGAAGPTGALGAQRGRGPPGGADACPPAATTIDDRGSPRWQTTSSAPSSERRRARRWSRWSGASWPCSPPR